MTKAKKTFRLIDDADGSVVLGGDVSERNVYIAAYGSVLPGEKLPGELEVGESTRKRYALSMTRPTVYRILRVS